jgi:hypothetical protein
MSDSRWILCLACGSDLSAYHNTPENGHPCPFCGRSNVASLPASIRRWLQVRLRSVQDVESLRVAQEELMTFLTTRKCDDARTTFLARLALEEAALSNIKREIGN